MNQSNPRVSSKEKQKNKPKIGVGSKDEKRKQKKEKLAKTLQMKKEAQNMTQAEPEVPVTFGKEFFDSLTKISMTDVSDMVRKPTKKEKISNAIMQMKQIYANSNFVNSSAIINQVERVLDDKSAMLQEKTVIEEQRRIEKERFEKQQQQENES